MFANIQNHSQGTTKGYDADRAAAGKTTPKGGTQSNIG